MATIALIAHDGKKADMVAWATFNRMALMNYQLVATSATAKLLHEKVGLEVEAVLPGPAQPKLHTLVQRMNADEELKQLWRCANVNAVDRLNWASFK